MQVLHIFKEFLIEKRRRKNTGCLLLTSLILLQFSSLAALANSKLADHELIDAEKHPILAAAAEQSFNSTASLPAAAAKDTPLQIEDLTRQILLKEIALERFNLNYKQNAAKQGRWKGIRYSLWGISNTSLGLAGGITSVYNRGIHVRRPSQVKVGLQENANTLAMIGNIIGAGAAGFEFLVNSFHEYQAHKRGFSPGTARKHVQGLLAEMNALQSKRDALLKLEQAEPSFQAQARVHEIEGRVIDALKDQSTLEFQRFHLSARKLLSFQQMQYFLDIAANSTGAIGANFAYLSLHRGRRVWNYRAGVLFTVSGAITMGAPIASRLFARAVTRYHGHKLKETIDQAENRDMDKLLKDLEELQTACRQDKDYCVTIKNSLARLDSYAQRSKIFQNQVEAASAQLAKSRLIATENVAAGFYTGGSRVAGGILFIIPGYFQLYNSKTSTAGRVTNDLLLASGIIGLPSSAFKLADTIRIQARGEYDRWKLAREGKLPAQQIEARLEQLNDLEAKMKQEVESSK